jgi:hypothetical protein
MSSINNTTAKTLKIICRKRQYIQDVVEKLPQPKPIIKLKLKNHTDVSHNGTSNIEMKQDKVNSINVKSIVMKEDNMDKGMDKGEKSINVKSIVMKEDNMDKGMDNGETSDIESTTMKQENVKLYECPQCHHTFTDRSNLYRHKTYRCKYKSSTNDLSTDEKNTQHVEQTVSNDERTDQIAQLREEIKQMQNKHDEKECELLNYLKKKDEQLLDVISKLQPNTVNIQQVNNNVIVFLTPKSMCPYDKKKQLYGARNAFDQIHKTLREAKPSNKLAWINDPDILGQSASPLTIDTNGDYIVHISPVQTKKCDVNTINKLANDIVTNSVITAINDAILPKTTQFSELDSEERSNMSSDFFDPIYDTPYGKGIYHDLERYQKIIPTSKHLKEIARHVV